jgi:hypothetical protein
VDAYQQVIRIEPDNVSSHYQLGLGFLELARKKEALDQYKILLALDKKTASALFSKIYPSSLKLDTASDPLP